ncbi:MAG: phospho-N-acetylmuramoyl-pentapeptide-transferase [Bacteroidales bacterium]|nr:phospho-N-acetylmuramoyl-pentapeptide-transferase [Bacteroidales bacterium]
MIYHLFEYLRTATNIPGAGVMQYISTRVFLCAATAILIALIWGKRIIGRLQKQQIGETIRDLGLEGQLSKKGTPTMGGLIILISFLISMLLFCDLTNKYVLLMIVSALWLGALGFADDYIKVFRKNKEGLPGKYKIVFQIVLGVIVALTLCLGPDRITTLTTIPFFKGNEFDYAWLAPGSGMLKDALQVVVFVVIIVFIITACSNGSNLTDGMDGLATGVCAIAGITLGVLAYLGGNSIQANYLNIMYLPQSGEMAIVMAGFVGALAGFLWYNSYPAQVFMGDTGSLALGGIIAVAAIIIRKELLLPLLCGVFVAESFSVIIQRYYFKYHRIKHGEGKRIFKMTPLHHHFQKEGIDSLIKKPVRAIPEAKIVMRFWLVSILLAILTVMTLKIR